MIHDSLKIGVDAALEKSREKLLSRRCHRRHARKLRYPFQPRNWSNGIHLFNRANSIGATPESLEREERRRSAKCAESQKNSLLSCSPLSHFRHLAAAATRGDGSPVYAFRRRKLLQDSRQRTEEFKVNWVVLRIYYIARKHELTCLVLL